MHTCSALNQRHDLVNEDLSRTSAPWYCRSSSQMGHFSSGRSLASNCAPQVAHTQFSPPPLPLDMVPLAVEQVDRGPCELQDAPGLEAHRLEWLFQCTRMAAPASTSTCTVQ